MTSPEPRAPAPTPDKWDSDTSRLAGFLEVRTRPAAQLRRGDTGVPRACSSSSPRQGPSPARPPGVLAWPSCCHSRPSLLDASVYPAPEQARSHLASVAPRSAHSRCALSAEGDQGNSETGRGPSSACPGTQLCLPWALPRGLHSRRFSVSSGALFTAAAHGRRASNLSQSHRGQCTCPGMVWLYRGGKGPAHVLPVTAPVNGSEEGNLF